MTAAARTRFLFVLVFLSVAGPAGADPLSDLLPPQARQLEKRALLGADIEQRMYYRGNQGRPGAAFSADGKYLAVSHPFSGMVLWDLAGSRNLGPVGTPEHSQGATLAFAPDGKHFLTASWAGGRHGAACPVTLWDAKKREKVRSLDDDVNETLFTAAAFSPDGKTLALGAANFNGRGGNPGLYFWDVNTGDEIRHLDGLVAVDPARRMSGVISSIAFAPDGRSLALLADGKVQLVELATSKVRTQIVVGPPPDARQEQMNEFPVGSVAFAPDGRTLAVGCQDGAVRRFDLRTGRELPPLTGHPAGVLALCYTADGKTLLSLGADQKLFFWPADANSDWRPKTIPTDEAALERLWDTLRTDDPLDLYGCSQLFGASPAPTVAFLRKRLAPPPAGDTARIEKLVAALQKPEYNERKKAAKELRELKEFSSLAVPALRQAAERGNSNLVQQMLMEFESQAPPREHLRSVRALNILERIGSDDARKLLGELAKGPPEAAFTVAAKAALERASRGGGGLDTPTTLETLWEKLAGDDSAAAFLAARQLAARSEAAVPFLRDHLLTLAASDAFDADPKRVARLLADLDSEEFDTRDKAAKALKTIGKLIEPELRKSLEADPSPEVKRQVEEILAEIGRQALSADVLRVGRALEALEWIGTPESRTAVEALAKEARGQWLREAATASLRRH